MSHSAPETGDTALDRAVLETNHDWQTPDHLSAGALRRIVRRILRTQSRRTVFEARVLDEAQCVANGQHFELACDTLERLVVGRLLGDGDGCRIKAAPLTDDAIFSATQLKVFNSTLALTPKRS